MPYSVYDEGVCCFCQGPCSIYSQCCSSCIRYPEWTLDILDSTNGHSDELNVYYKRSNVTRCYYSENEIRDIAKDKDYPGDAYKDFKDDIFAWIGAKEE